MAHPHRPRTFDEEIIGAELPAVATTDTDARRIARAAAELEKGFRALREIPPAVSVFGSARTSRDDEQYALALRTAGRLGDAGYGVITGGGPGIMEAANRGAREAGAHSVGLTIELPFEEQANEYCDLVLDFHYFFTRKVCFVRYASAFVVFPGGFGTMDELFEALTLIQTGKALDFPVVLVGRAYWSGLRDWLADTMLAEGKISPDDLHLLQVTDDPEAVVAAVAAGVARQGFPA
jgi:uncharacterized protein (TIGR00730 family)